jgi:16S rRNA (uracil1498-N3)-methyltransferase
VPRIHCPAPLAAEAVVDLPAAAARHAQVLRLQPGDPLTLFDGRGGEWDAQVHRMGRAGVQVQLLRHHAVEREAPREVHLAVGVPANERMDWLVEKAAELGVASVQPLLTERTVLRLSAERARRKQEHWQAIAAAACEQCGGNRVPAVYEPVEFARWQPAGAAARWLLSLADDARPFGEAAARGGPVLLLSGPEGGLSPREEDAARQAGFRPMRLGPRVLRAETAPVAALAALALAPPAPGVAA